MVATRKDVTNGMVSQDMSDANDNFIETWTYLEEVEEARDSESSLLAKIESVEASAAAAAHDSATAAAVSAAEAEELVENFELNTSVHLSAFNRQQYIAMGGF